jgi:hypothetical protein
LIDTSSHPDPRYGEPELPDDNIIWKSLHGQDADLVTLARRAGEVHRFLLDSGERSWI